MALISPQSTAVTGSSPTFSTPTASDTIRPQAGGALMVRSTGTATTVTLTIPGNTVFGQAQPDVAVVLAATDFKVIPMLAYTAAADVNGLVPVAFSGALTGVTAAYVIGI